MPEDSAPPAGPPEDPVPPIVAGADTETTNASGGSREEFSPFDDIERAFADKKPAGGSVGDGAPVAGALTMDEGRLTLLGKLGEGGMGAVWKARDNRLSRLVAVKRPKGALLRSRSGLERFLREARAVAQLSHPSIVTIYSVGKDAEGPFLEMEFVEGRSLREEVMNSGNGLPLERVCEIGAALCDALGLAHQQGVIHRDVKPGNILLTARGVPKLGDFGLAAARGEAGEGDRTSLTTTGAIIGTMYYASPEQLRDAKQVDARSDIYSLGATLYFAATGSDPRMLHLDRLPAAIRPALEQALEEAPSNRFQDMKAFEKALREAAKTGESGTDDARCPQCRKDNPLSARHCVHCGASLAGLLKACPACNVENRVGQRFCQSCGANLQALAEAERLRADIVCAQQTRQYEEIQRLAERGMNLLPGDSFFSDQLAEANKALQRVTELEGRLSHAPADDPDEAIRLLEQLLDLRPGHGGCRKALEKARAERARLEEEHRRIQLLQTIGEVRAQLDRAPPEDVDRRISLLARLVELAPEDRETQQALEQAQREKIGQHIRRLQETAKEHYLKREFQPALEALKQAQALAPDSGPLRRAMARVEEAQAAFEKARAKLIAAIEGMRDRGEYEKIVDIAARSPLAAHTEVQAHVRDAEKNLARLRELTDQAPALREARRYCQLHSVLEEIEALKVRLPERDALQGECARAIETAQRCHAEALQAAGARDFPRAIARCDEGLNACSDFVALAELRNQTHIRQRKRQRRRRALTAIGVGMALVAATAMEGYWAYHASAERTTEAYDWLSCRTAKTIPAYQRYLDKHGNGPHRREAQEAITTLAAEDEAAWLRAKNSNTEAAYEEYLAKHAEGLHTAEARSAQDEAAWALAKTANTEAAYQEYLAKHAEGLHAAEARSAQDEAAWAEAKTANTEAAYQEYLAKRAEGMHAAEARSAQDEAAWARARGENTVESYGRYRDAYARGAHVAEANAARTGLDDSAWSQAQTGNTVAAIQAYLQTFPKGRHIEEARSALSALEEKAEIGQIYVENSGGLNLGMVWIPGGTFQMGSPESEEGRRNDEGPVHPVTLDSFWLGKAEVTQAQYQAVMGSNPSRFEGAENPVESVSWNDATDFCRELSAASGKNYGLPTEAQWEYACRAGNQRGFCFGDDESQLGEYAWHHGNSGSQTHPVAQKKPNAWGLCDMHGNVWEWCADWYGPYGSSLERNPVGPGSARLRILRGGAWYDVPGDCRAALRGWSEPACMDHSRGFRVSRTPK